ncbi:related to NADH2 dehydrogenase (ubiquinone) 14K chain [Lecanosticta acicola]|uniref:Related to NADH2 dehydrogenase (Ubiquinone) 14K chain n=1 Tax=Lecanosticta acicola TaxID=111012 RepID=A0AAI8YTM3_9PEZI|nr:related to NADH2 dehydrogenase (ubiquinone) 14K chain [Lecanosticta acicola]
MVNKILFWSGFGLAVRFWQLGIEMRPFFQRENWLIYPIYGTLGASFGYWLQGVENKQMRYLSETRDRLIEKRKRRAQREGGLDAGSRSQREDEGLLASPRYVVEKDALSIPPDTQERTAAAS